MKRRLAPVLLLLGVAGCGGAAGSPTQPATPTMSGGPVVVTATDEFRFVPSRVEVGRGQPLRIRLTNAGSYPHNLVAGDLALRSDTVSGALGDAETTFTVDTSERGTFRFICTYHDQAGMTGEIVVR